MPEKVLQVVVVGGGLGGLCLAQGLRKAGIQVKVFERDRTVDARLDRYRLHINPAGTRALRACLPDAVWDRFLAAAGRPGGGFLFLDEQLHELLSIEDSLMYQTSDDPAERAYPVERRALRDVLLSDLADVVQFGKRFERYELQPNGGVTAWFTDGSRAEGDLLVGADGPHRKSAPNSAAGSAGRRRRGGLRGEAAADRTDKGLAAAGAARRRDHDHDRQSLLPLHLRLPTVGRAGRPGAATCCAHSWRDATRVPRSCGHGRAVDATGHRRPGERLAPHLAPADHCLRPGERRDVPVRIDDAAQLADRAGHPPRRRDPSHAAHRRPRCEHRHARCTPADPPARLRRRGQSDLVEATNGYEAEMREYGTAAVRSALTTLRQGLNTNRVQLAGTRAFFRACRVITPLRRVSFRDIGPANPPTAVGGVAICSRDTSPLGDR